MWGLTSVRNFVVGPPSANSAYSHHGCFSLVQNANGMSARLHSLSSRKGPSLILTPSLLEAENVHVQVGGGRNGTFRHLIHRGPHLLNRTRCGDRQLILESADSHHPGQSHLLLFAGELVALHLEPGEAHVRFLQEALLVNVKRPTTTRSGCQGRDVRFSTH